MLKYEYFLFLLVYDVQFSVCDDFSNVRVVATYQARADQSRGSKAMDFTQVARMFEWPPFSDFLFVQLLERKTNFCQINEIKVIEFIRRNRCVRFRIEQHPLPVVDERVEPVSYRRCLQFIQHLHMDKDLLIQAVDSIEDIGLSKACRMNDDVRVDEHRLLNHGWCPLVDD